MPVRQCYINICIYWVCSRLRRAQPLFSHIYCILFVNFGPLRIRQYLDYIDNVCVKMFVLVTIALLLLGFMFRCTVFRGYNLFVANVPLANEGYSMLATPPRQNTLATTLGYNVHRSCRGVLAAHVNLSKSRLACTVSNVTLNYVFKLKLVWFVTVFNATA